jgi:hypothetical protein
MRSEMMPGGWKRDVEAYLRSDERAAFRAAKAMLEDTYHENLHPVELFSLREFFDLMLDPRWEGQATAIDDYFDKSRFCFSLPYVMWDAYNLWSLAGADDIVDMLNEEGYLEDMQYGRGRLDPARYGLDRIPARKPTASKSRKAPAKRPTARKAPAKRTTAKRKAAGARR